MNCKKSRQLRKMAEVYLNEKETKYMTKKTFQAIEKPTMAQDRLYAVYRKMVKHAKRNYKQVPTPIKEKLGAEWKTRINEEY